MLGSLGHGRGSWVNKIIFINVIIFLLQIIFEKYQVNQLIPVGGVMYRHNLSFMAYYLGLTPASVVSNGFVWQIFTYMFIHSTHSFMHIFFNMYALLLFGSPVEQLWGSKRFIQYYLFTGVGAGVLILVINLIIGGVSPHIPTIGASGAVFGLLLAFGLLFPEAELLVFFFIPMKAKFLVIIYGLLEFYMLITSGGSSNVSHVGHLGGLLFGIIYFVIMRKNFIKFKTREIKAKTGKEHRVREDNFKRNKNEKKERLFDILMKVRSGGIDSISDDEYQFIRELDIMVDHETEKCTGLVIDNKDKRVIENENFEICALEELRKYI